MIGTTNIATYLSENYKLSTMKHNNELQTNREVLLKLIALDFMRSMIAMIKNLIVKSENFF